ncbi:hypothetical protein ACE418_13105 [Megasphaera sp. WILCCON 0056]|uniref:hypothetical protein n=1 Tax=Megasphaera sp. WILCCON 0056 TaxID=3345340 RepID=UPI003A7FA5E3
MWIVQKIKIWYNEAKRVSSKNASEKITTLHNDFGIDLTQEGERDLAVMCNLGEGIYEDGLMKGSKKDGKKAEKKVEQKVKRKAEPKGIWNSLSNC